MKPNLFFCLISCSIAFLFSCKKGELPVPKHNPGNVITNTVDMTASYKWQIYFDLKTNSAVGKNLKTVWDLGFETNADGFHIVLNASKVMYAYNTGSSDFSSVSDTTGFALNKKWDEPTGDMDYTAVGNWQLNTPVYIIDRGYSETGMPQGFRKIQFLTVNSTGYTVRFAQLNGSDEVTLQVPKDSAYNFTFLSFTTSKTLIVEPPKATWDLVFTQYTHIFHDLIPPTPYLVTGCLLNRHNTHAIMDSIVLFNEIDYVFASGKMLSQNINTIGYNWKTYTGGTYVVHPKMNYIIKDNEGFYYKLYFTDFLSQSGTTGNPKWEFQQL